MSVNQKVDIFTAKMRTEFLNSYLATAEPAEFKRYTTVVPSSARIEHYTGMGPTPGIGLYQGHRRYGVVDTYKYSVENKEFDVGFEVLLRDIEDDQTNGYELKPKEMSERARLFPSRWVIKHLAAGESRLCFDGTDFFANSHNIGTGDNLLSATGSGSGTFKLAALFHGHQLKPLLWQERKAPQFRTTAGTVQSDEAKIVRYFLDMEGEAAYGWWHDAVLVNISGKPTVSEMHEIFEDIETAFRGFQLPKSMPSEDGEYVHEQTVFGTDNLTLVGSVGLGAVLRQALNGEWTPQTIAGGQGTGSGTAQTVADTNRYKGFANYVVSAFMNT